jgi:hypothetical protein
MCSPPPPPRLSPVVTMMHAAKGVAHAPLWCLGWEGPRPCPRPFPLLRLWVHHDALRRRGVVGPHQLTPSAARPVPTPIRFSWPNMDSAVEIAVKDGIVPFRTLFAAPPPAAPGHPSAPRVDPSVYGPAVARSEVR